MLLGFWASLSFSLSSFFSHHISSRKGSASVILPEEPGVERYGCHVGFFLIGWIWPPFSPESSVLGNNAESPILPLEVPLRRRTIKKSNIFIPSNLLLEVFDLCTGWRSAYATEMDLDYGKCWKSPQVCHSESAYSVWCEIWILQTLFSLWYCRIGRHYCS